MLTKLEKIILLNSNDLFEREQILRLIYVALFSQENVFLLGPPGVAKSLLSRRVSKSIKEATYFEYLMNKFSTPEEIFGPISLKKLDEDKYERKIENYLPSANIAFLDEIWKSSSSIQNTLLTIINEKIFVNGTQIIKTPLYFLISASNEIPPINEGFDALYDRFLLRIMVQNIQDNENFIKYLTNSNKFNLNEEDKISLLDIKKVQDKKEFIICPQDILEAILNIRKLIEENNKRINELEQEENDTDDESETSEEDKIMFPYVSDRRWKKIIDFLKCNAILSARNSLSIFDLLLIPNLIWDKPDQINKIETLVNEVIVQNIFRKCVDIMKIEEYEMIKNLAISKMNNISQYSYKLIDDVGDYQTIEINGINYVVCYCKSSKEYYYVIAKEIFDSFVLNVYRSYNKKLNVLISKEKLIDKSKLKEKEVQVDFSVNGKTYHLSIDYRKCSFLKNINNDETRELKEFVKDLNEFNVEIDNLKKSIALYEEEFKTFYSFGLVKDKCNLFDQMKTKNKTIKSENTKLIKRIDWWVKKD